MALQLGFGDAVKLLTDDDASIREVLGLTAARYRDMARRIDVGEDSRAVYWRIVFAILTVHSPIDASFEAYRSLRLWRARFGRLPGQQKLASLLLGARGSDGVIQYAPSKARYVREFDKAWQADARRFTREGDSDSDWRARLKRNVLGLGWAKASFAVALCSPASADVACIDTHIYALFHGGRPPGKSLSKRVYMETEARVRAYARGHDLSTFACQWALWDARRGSVNPHLALATP